MLFFYFQDIKDFPNLIRKPEIDLLVFGQAVQSASQKQLSESAASLLNMKPRPGVFFKYLTTLNVASQCDLLGPYINSLRICTIMLMSGLVVVKYNNFPIILWYPVICTSNASSLFPVHSS